ncbi:MAG: putative metal-dependent hydrolase [Candidatus Peregrinibacteria bacterium Greene1014_49]|nr:MAG: putative metal-dependent hydrolase [Candidatus Peregrinibacteria bacterium Greene1014_49]
MASPHIVHRVVHTRNKHSRAVLKGDTVIIRLARNLSRTEEQDHIRDLLRRMTRIVLEERTKVLINPFGPLLHGAQRCTVELATGKKLLFTLEAGKRTTARRTKDGWRISVGPVCRRATLHRFLWKLLGTSEQERITRLVDAVNDRTLGVRIRGVKLRFASSQWGSCSSKGIIMLNAGLLLIPERYLRYIIIHELSHRIRADHSAAFWRVVEGAMPKYDAARKELMEYRLPTL